MTASRLQPFLEQLYRNYHRTRYLSSDPLEFVHRYSANAWDQEAVALVAAVLAYGNVKQIRRSVEDVLARIRLLGGTPREFVEGLSEPARLAEARHGFKSFVHRFNQGRDLVLLFQLLNLSWRRHGSLGAHFLTHLAPEAVHIGEALDGLMKDWRAWVKVDLSAGRSKTAFSYLLTSPGDGSCCKRWCMFLRWMGRDDQEGDRLDLGLWTGRSPLAATFPKGRALHSQQLIIPLDTHTGRISQYLGLTRRKTLNWKAAVEVTVALKGCHELDPTRYDFALARLGILDLCQRSYRREICENCDLKPACKFALHGATRKVRPKVQHEKS